MQAGEKASLRSAGYCSQTEQEKFGTFKLEEVFFFQGSNAAALQKNWKKLSLNAESKRRI